MKYILFILLVGGIVGCVNPDKDKKPDEVKIDNRADNSVRVITVNGCQYVVYHSYQAGGIAHAGNCNNHSDKVESDADFRFDPSGDTIVIYNPSSYKFSSPIKP